MKTIPWENAVSYCAFGAAGDGKTNDIQAIIAAHAYANAHGLPVRGDAGKIFYISAASEGAVVQTDTDWTDVSFIIDDSGVGVDDKDVHIFSVTPASESYEAESVPDSIRKGQTKLDIPLPGPSMLLLQEKGKRRYIRFGDPAGKGAPQTEAVLVDGDGNVDPAAPIVWEYENITSLRIFPADPEPLTIRGGTFTTIANRQEVNCAYYSRGIKITRSNVVLDGLKHYVVGEDGISAPYFGILTVQNCANTTIRNCVFTAHKDCAMGGTYDITLICTVNLTFENCIQQNDILDGKYFGVMGSNLCKNITMKECIFSRFDAHEGVANTTILGCTLGRQCLNAIGFGTLRVEDSTLYGWSFINLRPDYGASWEGDVIIRRCTWIPYMGNPLKDNHSVINGGHDDFRDYGYDCCMPRHITIDGLHVDDSRGVEGFPGVFLLSNATGRRTSEAYEAEAKANGRLYAVPETLTVSGFTTASGRTWNLSPNPFMYRSVSVNGADSQQH